MVHRKTVTRKIEHPAFRSLQKPEPDYSALMDETAQNPNVVVKGRIRALGFRVIYIDKETECYLAMGVSGEDEVTFLPLKGDVVEAMKLIERLKALFDHHVKSPISVAWKASRGKHRGG